MSKFYHAMEIWFVKMSTGGNPPFVAELAMRQVWSEVYSIYTESENYNYFSIIF